MKFGLFLYSKSIALYIAVLIVNVQSFWTEFEWIGVENSKTGIVTTDLKVTRVNKTNYSLRGTITVTADLNDDYDCQINAYLSTKGNNQYVLLPYKMPRDACCNLFESTYVRSVQKRLEESSNIPKRNGKEPYCLSLKKGEITLRHFTFDYSIIPRHFDTGTYKCEVLMYKKQSSEISSTSLFFVKLY